VNVETKEQPNQWMHAHSPNKPKMLKQTLPAKPVFWDSTAVLMVEFMKQETTVTSEVYCETLKKLRRAIQNKRHGMLTPGVVLLHDNARQHAVAHTGALLEHFNWELFDYPTYSSDFALRDYRLFTYLKNCFGSQRFNNEEMM
jgi:hypothetical protein